VQAPGVGIVSRSPEVAALVADLVGVWSGSGEGSYPTIESFRYREVTEITQRSDHPALHFDQRTWKSTAEGEVVSHWETGLLTFSSDGGARLHDAQPGRVETMSGTWLRDEAGCTINLRSTGYAGDDRVVASTRALRLTRGKLTYEMHMETVTTSELILHLRGRLFRS